MKRKKLKIIVFIIGFIALSNYLSPYINVFTEGLYTSYLYQTKNAEFEFTTVPSKGRDIEMMERQFSDFKEKNPEYRDLELNRTFKRNPLKFWNWYWYLTQDMFKYNYQNAVPSFSGKGKFGI